MRGIHLSFTEGIFYLWAEEFRQGNAPPLPSLSKHLHEAGLIASPRKAPLVRGTFWLPSRGKAFLPSSPLLGNEPDRRRKIVAAPHSISALPLKIEDLLELFEKETLQSPPGSRLILGNSLLWGARLFGLAQNIAARENYLPSLRFRKSQWEALWIPVLSEEAEREAERLRESLPGVLRCMTLGEEKTPEISPRQHVEEMLAALLDGILRFRLREKEARKGSSPQFASLHDAWIEALQSSSPRVRWKNEEDLKGFARTLASWSRPARLHGDSPLRFCLRLEEPRDAGENFQDWKVQYLLQPKEDPSLLVPLEHFWKDEKGISLPGCSSGKVLREFLLAALAQGARLSPRMAASLERKNPWGFFLDASEALHFLKEEAPALQASGFTLQLPSWWVRGEGLKQVSLTARISSPPSEDSGMSLETLLDFRYVLSLGGEELTPEEMHMLATMKAPLVRFRGQWIETSPDHLRKALDFLKKQGSRQVVARELLAPALKDEGLGNEDFPVEKVQVEGWFAKILEDLKEKKAPLPEELPRNFSGTLRHYQEEGFAWLASLRRWNLGACLADDMGLGKTVQTLAHLQREREKGETRPALLICPTSVANNWRKEAERFTPGLPVLVHHGSSRHRKKNFLSAAENQGLVISTFGLLQRDLPLFQEVSWSSFILDEAQNIKNPETKQSRAARSIPAKHRIALTGTPVENRPLDLWSLMDFLNPGLLGSQGFFTKTFHKSRENPQKEKALEKLKNLTSPFVLRRLKTDRSIIQDLPEKIITREYCSLTKEQASLYQSVLEEMKQGLEKGGEKERQGLVLATLTKLKQICNHPVQFLRDNSPLENRSGKLRRLVDLLEEIQEAREYCLIFTQYREMGEMLQSWLQQYFAREIFLLHGGVPRKKRDEMVDIFQNSPEAPQIFILSLKAGGTGLTLTRANHVIHYDRWWNPAVENQATDRAFRIGQKKNVQVHTFLVPGTLEERIEILLERKRNLAEKIVGTDNLWLGNLSDRELQDLLRLDPEALEE
ncbi:MAG TPA: DEAD/DEAH box helicase [Synergistaceae bacterium]|nr:DEAD/DEAH box helicase [Synergistaceae bacterium]